METYESQVKLFKALTHPVRLAILELLREGEHCVCHIESVLGYRQAYISQQLMVLREAGLVQDRREGWNVFYRVSQPEIYAILDGARRLSGETPLLRTIFNPAKVCTCPKCNPVAQTA